MPIRDFTSQQQNSAPTGRTVDDAAPEGLRQEFIDLVYQVHRNIPQRLHRFGQTMQYNQQYHPLFDEANLHKVITQSLGFSAAGEPYGGFRYAVGRDIGKAEWSRVYDLMSRLWDEIPSELRESYRSGVNRILAAYSIAWDMGADGSLHRVTPPAIEHQIEEVFRELSGTRFAAALQSFHDAMAAYDDRPQRARDVCKNIMDALEGVAKEVFGMPTATFGNILTEARKGPVMALETISVLQKMYDLANNHFRHGMTSPFVLKRAEVDFVLVSCLGGILLFVRL